MRSRSDAAAPRRKKLGGRGVTVKHPVVTKDYPENLNGGIMVCGIDFGFTASDEEAERENTAPSSEEPKSFFSDLAVRTTDKFRRRLLRWLDLWGVTLEKESGSESARERSFFQTNWLDTQNRNNSGPVDDLVDGADHFLKLLEDRKPRVILFSGANLIEALNNGRIRKKVEKTLGAWPGKASIHKMEAVGGGKSFTVRVQHWQNTTVISLPHPTGSWGISDSYMAQFGDLLRPLIEAGL